MLGWKASRVGVLPSAWAGDPLLPPAFGGEGCSPALRRRQTSTTRGRLVAGAVSCRVSGSLVWMALVPPPTLPPVVKWGVAIHPPHERRSRRAQVHRIRSVPCAAGHAAWGVVQDVIHHGGGGHVLGWSCPHSRWRTGARTSSRVLRQSLPTGAEVAAVVGAEVVVADGEAARCRGGCLRWRDHQCHLPPSLQLFGFNGLVVAPRRKTGARTLSHRRTC